MNHRRDDGTRTFDTIRDRYDDWDHPDRARPPSSRGLFQMERQADSPIGRIVMTVIGVGIGLVLLGLAGYAFWTAAWWSEVGRAGATTGYRVVGFFLVIAGAGCIAATVNHNFRVLTRPPAHDH
jgi:hypothetical protein